MKGRGFCSVLHKIQWKELTKNDQYFQNYFPLRVHICLKLKFYHQVLGPSKKVCNIKRRGKYEYRQVHILKEGVYYKTDTAFRTAFYHLEYIFLCQASRWLSRNDVLVLAFSTLSKRTEYQVCDIMLHKSNTKNLVTSPSTSLSVHKDSEVWRRDLFPGENVSRASNIVWRCDRDAYLHSTLTSSPFGLNHLVSQQPL